MKLNNKGITLVEIIISIALISIVLVFLFSLLVTVNDMNDEAEINSTYLINKSLILKNIDEDLSKSHSIKITACSNGAKDIYSNYGGTSYFGENESLKANECIDIEFDDTTHAKLGIYYYKNRESYVISYIHGNIKATRELPDFEDKEYNVKDGKLKNTIKLVNSSNTCIYQENSSPTFSPTNCSTNDGFYKIEIPIIGEDGKDYTIIISYYGKVTVTTS